MARNVVVEVLCDICGQPVGDGQDIEFAFENQSYRADLCPTHLEEFRSTLNPYVSTAQAVGARRGRRSTAPASTRPASSATRRDPRADGRDPCLGALPRLHALRPRADPPRGRGGLQQPRAPLTDGSRPAAGWALFATPVGRCGIAWSSRGVVAVALPGPDDASTRSSLVARCPAGEEGPPPPAVAAAVEAIVGMLRGGGVDLGAIALDMTGVPRSTARSMRRRGPSRRARRRATASWPPGWAHPARRGGPGAAPQPVRHRGAVPPRPRRRRPGGRLLGHGRGGHQAPPARPRGHRALIGPLGWWFCR